MKKLFILGLVLLLMLNLVSATVYYFDDFSSSGASASWSSTGGTITGTFNTTGEKLKIDFAAGTTGQGYCYDYGAKISNSLVLSYRIKYAYTTKVHQTNICDGDTLSYCGVTNNYVYGVNNEDATPNWYYYFGGNNYGNSVTFETFYNINQTINISTNTYDVIINGATEFNDIPLTAGSLDDFRKFCWGIVGGSPPASDVVLDYLCIADTLAECDLEINQDIPAYVAPTPADDKTTNTQETINITCKSGDVNILFDQNNPPTTYVVSNGTSPSSYTTSMSTEGTYYYYAQCVGGITSNSSIRTLTYDVTDPTIILNPSSFFNDSNLSMVSRVQTNDLLNFTLIDNIDLYAYEVNITYNGNQTTYFNYTNESLTGNTQLDVLKYINFTTWPLGFYTAKITASDSHTANAIKDYQYFETPTSLTFLTEEGNEINILSFRNADWEIEKKIDRYSFTFTPYETDAQGKYKFQIYCDNGFKYLPNSDYDGHFVCIGEDLRGNWLDFEGTENEIIVIDEGEGWFEIEVEFEGDSITFNSIGGLNTNEESYLFELASLVPFDIKIELSDKLQYQGLDELTTERIELNKTFMNDILQSCSCEGCIDLGGSCRFPIYFYSDTSSIMQVELINATIYTNLTVNLYDRETNNLITTPSSIIIQGVNNYSTSTGIINIENFNTEPGPYTIRASSEGYTTDQTSFQLTDINSTTVNMFLINSSSPTGGKLIVQVFDDWFNLIIGANLKLLEYNPSLDSFIEVSQCFSNSNGECVFDVELNTKFYIVTGTATINGIDYTAQSTSTGELIKIDQTIIDLHLKTAETFELGPLYDLIVIPSNTTLIGNTSYLTATFNDPTNTEHNVCIGYYISQEGRETLLDETCITASAGIINYASGYVLNRDYTYIAKIYVNSEGSQVIYNEYTYTALEGSFLSEFDYYLKPLILFLFLCLLAASIYLKKITIFAIGTIPLATISIRWNPSLWGGVTLVFIYLMCIIAIYLERRKNESF